MSDAHDTSDVNTSRRKFVRKMAYVPPVVMSLTSVPSYATYGSHQGVTKKKVAVKKKIAVKKKAATKKKVVTKKKAATQKKAATKKKVATKKRLW